MKTTPRQQLTVLSALILASVALGASSHCLFKQRREFGEVLGLTDAEIPHGDDHVPGRAIPPIGQVPLDILRDLVQNRAAIVVDARLKSLYQQGHVPGAVSLPALRPDPDALDKILQYPQNSTLVVYCQSDNCSEGESVAEILRDRGMMNVRIFTGGWEQWSSRGLPIETGIPKLLEQAG